VGVVIYARKIGRCVEEEYDGESEEWEFELYNSREFLADLKEEFNRRDNKIMKVVKLKKIEQESKIIEEFVQEFRRVARESEYERKLLVEKFKKEMNEVIR